VGAWGRELWVERGGAHKTGRHVHTCVAGVAHVKRKEHGSAVCKTRDSASCWQPTLVDSSSASRQQPMAAHIRPHGYEWETQEIGPLRGGAGFRSIAISGMRKRIPKGGRESRDGVQRGMKGSYMDTLWVEIFETDLRVNLLGSLDWEPRGDLAS